MKKSKTNGICKLTGKEGRFVNSHLIPKALTRPEEKGLPFVQVGQVSRPSRRWSSWSDRRLVIQDGENVLSALDNWAIPTLRSHKLIWSGWGPLQELVVKDHKQIPNSPWGWGIRKLPGIDPARLRLFFLSLLWRAAATDLPEFSEIVIPPDHLKKLSSMLLDGNPLPLSFYPATLSQLSTLGIAHNQTPLAEIKIIPALGSQPEQSMPIFRFYFEGLIVHIIRQSSDHTIEGLGPLVVGAGKELVISTIPFDTSYQKENINHIISEARRDWPELVSKFWLRR